MHTIAAFHKEDRAHPMARSQFILKSYVKFRVAAAEFRHRKHAPEKRLRLIWRSLSRDVALWRLLPRLVVRNPRMCSRKKLLSIILRRNPELNVAIRFHVPPALRQALDQHEALLFLHIHEGHRSLSSFLGHEGREHVRLGRNKENYLRKLSTDGFDPALVHFVQRDEMSLLFFRDLLKLCLPICCAVDFTAEGRKQGFISPAMFAFAMRFKVPTVFVKSSVTEAGEIQFHCQPSREATDAEASARYFIEFFNSTGTTRAEFEVRQFPG